MFFSKNQWINILMSKVFWILTSSPHLQNMPPKKSSVEFSAFLPQHHPFVSVSFFLRFVSVSFRKRRTSDSTLRRKSRHKSSKRPERPIKAHDSDVWRDFGMCRPIIKTRVSHKLQKNVDLVGGWTNANPFETYAKVKLDPLKPPTSD